ncbi:MAG: ABC transporter ATP-binding protein [Alphaproteobacteria bacterium]|nr:ABC transporter ATP-binding protein [Alphaproteobacteria bacterium]
MTHPLITLNDIFVSYGRHVALQSVSGQFACGSLTAVAGPNGSGKSTLLKAIAGVLHPTRGTIAFADNVRPSMAYLPQAVHLQRDFPLSVLDVVLTGFYPEAGEAGGLSKAQKQVASKALGEVGLGGFEKRQINALSGGELQRTLFARVIVQNANVILLDEPFSAVDAATTARLIQLLLKWHEEGRTIICVLHDLLLIKKYFPESMVLQGKCLGSGHTHQMFEQKLLSFDLDMAELVPPEDPLHHQTHRDHHGHNHDHGHHKHGPGDHA